MAIETAAEVEKHALTLLRDCGVKVAPTPLNSLLERQQLQLFPFLLPHETGFPKLVTDSVRAFIHVKEKEIYVSKHLHEKQQRFASFHETGHYALPWHREIFYGCSEIDLTPKARKIFDAEANAFAAACIFQGPRFGEEAADLKFGMRSVMKMAERYDVSFESAARRYVEGYPTPCALIVCDRIPNGEENAHGLQLNYAIRTENFPFWFERGSIIPATHNIAKSCRATRDSPLREKVILDGTGHTAVKCSAHAFFNGYKALILLKPRRFKGNATALALG